MNLSRNRYPINTLKNQFLSLEPVFEDDEWVVEFDLSNSTGQIDDFSISWSPDVSIDSCMPAICRTVIEDLNYLDNLVQDSCENDFLQSEHSIVNYMLHIAYILVTSDEVIVHYYGSEVNTEWSAKFTHDENNKWHKLNF